MASESSIPMLNVQIDGVWRPIPKGTRLIEACEQAVATCRLLLSQETFFARQLPNVPDRNGPAEMGPDRKPDLGPDGKRHQLDAAPAIPAHKMSPKEWACARCRRWSRNAGVV